MQSRRIQQQQEETLRNVEILRGLGLTESPISQFGSLINALNSTDAPAIQQGQFEKTFGLQQSGQQQQASEFAQSHALAQQNYALAQQGQDWQHWGMENDMNQKAWEQYLQSKKFEQEQGNHNDMMQHYGAALAQQGEQGGLQALLHMFGLNQESTSRGMPALFNQDVLGSLASQHGFSNLLNSVSNVSTLGPKASWSDAEVAAARQKLGLK